VLTNNKNNIMNNKDKKEIRAFIKQAVINAEQYAKAYGEKSGDRINYAYAYGYLTSSILAYVDIYESSQNLVPDPEA
jgi:hypothetical protein